MDKQKLAVSKRTVTGRKVKKLRKEGSLPASLYGKKVKSVALQMPRKDFETVYEKSGETGVIELSGLGEARPVLVKNVQIHPVTNAILHVDFHQVDLKEKVKSDIPLETTGEAPAVTDKKGVLLTKLDAIEVEALPTDLPEKILVDVSALAEVGETIKVGQLSVPSAVSVLTDPELEVVKIDELVSKEAEEQIKEEEEQAAQAAEEGTKEDEEKAEGSEGEEKKEETKKGDKEEASEKKQEESKKEAPKEENK